MTLIKDIDLMHDPHYLDLLLKGLEDNISDLQDWSAYNSDAASDQIALMSAQFDMIKINLLPDPTQEADSYIESGAGE